MGLGFKLVKNMGYLTFGNQVGNLLQFLFFLYFARVFGDEAVGQYSFAFSYTYIFSVLADLGLSAYLIREIARDRTGDRTLFSQGLLLRTAALVIFFSLAAIIALVFFKNFSNETLKVLFLMGLFHIFLSLADVFLAEFKAHDRMGLVGLLNAIVRLIISGVGAILIVLNHNFVTVLICFPIGSFLYLLVCISLSFYYYRKIEFRLRNVSFKKLFVPILPFAITIIFVEVLHHLDILMLRFFKDDRSVGIYSAANKIVLAILGINAFVHTALLPTFSRLFIESKSKLIEVSQKSLRVFIILALPVSAGLFALSDRTIILLFSNKFETSSGVLNILTWIIALGFIAAPFSVLLTAINRQTQKVIIVGICLLLNFILNFILIPRWDYYGAAAAKLTAELLFFLLAVFLISKYLSSLSIHKILIKPALSCMIMIAFLYVFKEWNLIPLLTASASVYFISLGILHGYSDEELNYLKNFLGKFFGRNEISSK
jgi:O-antigen/teichoic acid export membrane protein